MTEVIQTLKQIKTVIRNRIEQIRSDRRSRSMDLRIAREVYEAEMQVLSHEEARLSDWLENISSEEGQGQEEREE